MWEEIVKSFSDLTPILWASQILGLVGFLFIGISYLFKKKLFILLAAIAMVFFVFEQAFASLYANLIVTASCCIRNCIMVFLLWKHNKELPKWGLFAISGIMWIAVIIYMAISNNFTQWDCYLPPALSTLTTFTQNAKNEFVVKIGAIFQEFGFMIYYLIYRLPFSVMRQAILVIACIIGLIILIVKYIRKEKEKDISNEPI